MRNNIIKRKLFYLLITLIIIITAAYVRFSPIFSKGLFVVDSGTYANEGKFVYYTIQWFFQQDMDISKTLNNLPEMREYIMSRGGSYPDTGKIGFAVLIFLCYLIFGIHDWSVLMLSAGLSMSTFFLIGFMAYRYYGVKTMIFSILIIAISKWTVFFSHLGYAEISSSFFVLLALYLYIKAHEPKTSSVILCLSGAISAFALTINYKTFSVPVVIIGIEIFNGILLRKESIKKTIIRISVFLGSFMLCILFVELLHVMVKDLAPSDYFAHGKFMTYVDQFFCRSTTSRKYYPTIFGIFEFIKQFCRFEGIHIFILSLISIVYVSLSIKKKYAFHSLAILLFYCVHLVLWSVNTGKHPSPKPFPIALPTMALLIGFTLSELHTSIISIIKYRYVARIACSGFFIFIYLYGIDNVRPFLHSTAGYRVACEKLEQYIYKHGGTLTGNQGSLESILRFYIGNIYEKNKKIRHNVDLVTRDKLGDYVLLDFSQYTKLKKHEKFHVLTRDLDPIIVVDNNYVEHVSFLFSGDILAGVIQAKKNAPDFDKIRIYDLRRKI